MIGGNKHEPPQQVINTFSLFTGHTSCDNKDEGVLCTSLQPQFYEATPLLDQNHARLLPLVGNVERKPL